MQKDCVFQSFFLLAVTPRKWQIEERRAPNSHKEDFSEKLPSWTAGTKLEKLSWEKGKTVFIGKQSLALPTVAKSIMKCYGPPKFHFALADNP